MILKIINNKESENEMPRLIIQTHKYAPELNTVYILKGGKLHALKRCRKTWGLTNIKDARAKLFNKIDTPFIYATVEKVFPAPYEYLNKTKSGRVNSRGDVLNYIREDKEKNKYGEFIDMSHCDLVESYIMPTPKFNVKTRLVG